MGPPGAGKGTQAKRLAAEFRMDHLSSGDIFRSERDCGSQLGAKLARYMEAGELVPDEIVVDVMAKAITDSDAEGGLLLDGFPRTVAQAQTLDEQLERLGAPLDAVVILSASEEVIVDRITGRRSCPKCGRIYHVRNMPPAEAGKCDDCKVNLVQRGDDTAPVVRERLAAYREQTEPVLEYYRQRKGLRIIEVSGDDPAEVVYGRLAEALQAVQSAR